MTDEIICKIKKAGGQLYLVGGAIRDFLLGRDIYDLDFVICNMSEKTLYSIFPNIVSNGKQFKVFNLDGNDIALARIDMKKGKRHNDFDIESNENISIEDDLKRRDLTINSIAIKIDDIKDIIYITNTKDCFNEKLEHFKKRIIDPSCGIEDLKQKIIRAQNESFIEDPLRIYRAARFASSLEFKIDDKTLSLMKNAKDSLKYLSMQRVFSEFLKALKSNKPSIFFKSLKEADILDVHFEVLCKLLKSKEPQKYHMEENTFDHTMNSLDFCAKKTDDEKIRFAVLTHDFGKSLTNPKDYPHHFGHEKVGLDVIDDFCKDMLVPNKLKKVAKQASYFHMKAGFFDGLSIKKQVKFLEDISRLELSPKELELVVYCDRKYLKIEEKDKKIEFAYLVPIIIDGVKFKDIAKQLYEKDKLKNNFDGDFDEYISKNFVKVKDKMHSIRVEMLKKIRNN